jgi:Rho GTPase-activating protein 39
MALIFYCFPPSEKELVVACRYLLQTLQKDTKTEAGQFANIAEKYLSRSSFTGARKTLPEDDIIAELMKPILLKPIFGATIEEYFAWQTEEYPDEEEPFVLSIMSDYLLKVDAFNTLGIFRLPGDTDEIERHKDKMNMGNFKIETKNPHTAGSLFKVWLRELSTPIVPNNMYDECINATKNGK